MLGISPGDCDATDSLLPVVSPEQGNPPQGKSDHPRNERKVCGMCKMINVARGGEFRARGPLHREIEIIFCALWTAYSTMIQNYSHNPKNHYVVD